MTKKKWRPATGRRDKRYGVSIPPRPTIAQIKARVHPLSFYAQRLDPLVKRGRYAQARCPFHNDRHPSFSVDCETGTARCFACGWRGDIVTFAMDFHGVSMPVALTMLQREG